MDSRPHNRRCAASTRVIRILSCERRLETQHAGSGFSLVDCLISNALALALISLLSSASADIISTIQVAAERGDQSLRLRQVHRFLDITLLTAKMPAPWTAYAVSPNQWQLPSDPCVSPAIGGDRPQWGGVAIIDLSEMPCLPGAVTGYGLYVETVHPCPQGCEKRSGYRVRPAECETEPRREAGTRVQWRAEWQEVLSHPKECPQDTPWGRIERLLLSHRSAADAQGDQPELRVQSLVGGPEFGWTTAETLVAGIEDWQIRQLEISRPPVSSPIGVDDSPAVQIDKLPRHLLQMVISAAATHPRQPLAPMTSSRLLVPTY